MLSRVARPWWSFAAMLPFVVLAGLSCTSDGEGRPDSELGNLVISPSTDVHEVDIDKATLDSDELLAAVLLPHTWLGESLGAHVMRGTSRVVVREGEQVAQELTDALELDFDGEGRFAATLDNSNEYGRHAIFDGTNLYLRPRFGLYHSRAPQTEGEAAAIRTEMAAGAGEYLDLLSRGLEVSDEGAATRDGRAVRKIELKVAPKPRSIPVETRTQKLWRNSIEVTALKGQVELDAETGAPVLVDFAGSIAFERDGRRFHMDVKAHRSIGDIGHSRAVEAPPANEVMAIKARRRELNERNKLLKNIAPPARGAPTPKGARGASQ